MSSPDPASMSDADVQAMLADAVKIYAARAQDRDSALAAFPADAPVTATEAMTAISAIMRAVNIQVFELGMWQAWSGR